ncbi:uncharacterized protein LOC118820370 [Colossoma macropomum]|uniref:uncharacterized protein LOC118820370 n=1 Tax=Colossoma macropomum TaxID=42526 RepID=UPI00186560DD|nr:uncharacterized protein LOC118820370 [Colossoma macropomum]
MVIPMFLVLLTAVTVQGELSACNVSDGLQLFGVLGKSVLLCLPVPTNTQEVQLQRDRERLLKFKIPENKTTDRNQNHFEFFINGTVRIRNITYNDSGVYKWETYNSAGTFLLNITFTLKIHEPLPKPHLDILCQSFGERRVQCTPAGQNYRWTLNSTEINSTVAYMSDPADVIILKGHVIGNLTCTVYDKVDRDFTTARLPVCKWCNYSKQVCADGEENPGPNRILDTTVQKDQFCVNYTIFLLACGALAVLVTLTLALCCLRIALDTTSGSLPDDQPVYSEIEFKSKEEKKEWSEMQRKTAMYAEVRKGYNDQQPEGQRDTSNQNFSMYSHD